jgi:plastocyanin
MRLLALLAGVAVLGGGAPSRAQVVEREYSLTLSRLQLHAGTATIEIVNMGQDPHDLRVQRTGARHIAGTPVVAPGHRAELSLKLAPGRYSVWCSVADHRARGMRATLVVTR